MAPWINISVSKLSGILSITFLISSLFISLERITLLAPFFCQNLAVCALRVFACVLIWISILGAISWINWITPPSAAIIASTFNLSSNLICFSIASYKSSEA